jgi:hypothetical protein
MAAFKCPSPTCSFIYQGSIQDLTAPSIWHTEGSHNHIFNPEDIIKIVDEQAHGIFINYFIKPNEKAIDLKKWWMKINKTN